MAADDGGDDMKRRAAILMIMVMASLWQQAISLDQTDSMRSPVPDHSSNPLPGSAIKKMEERMAESLAALPSYSVRGAADILQNSPEGNDSLGNGRSSLKISADKVSIYDSNDPRSGFHQTRNLFQRPCRG